MPRDLLYVASIIPEGPSGPKFSLRAGQASRFLPVGSHLQILLLPEEGRQGDLTTK